MRQPLSLGRNLFFFLLVILMFAQSTFAEERKFTAGERAYWAFQPVRIPVLPSHTLADSTSREWPSSPLDSFILDALQRESLRPSVAADRYTFLRRVFLDVTGLLPNKEEIVEFAADDRPDAKDRLGDRLLASPHYGERWARHWLDLAVYAESSGFEQDETRPNAWRYRDYVVTSFNGDKPYDQFVTEQLAGDEVWPDVTEAQIATSFMRHYPEEGNNKDILLARQEILHHITDVVGSTFLGLTFNCAQCHDHKYDPILQKDYYRLQSFFANVGHDDKRPIGGADEIRDYLEKLATYEQRSDPLWNELDQLLATARKYSPQQLLARYPDYVIQAMAAPPTKRTPLQSQIAHILHNKDCGTCPQRPKPHSDPFFARDAKALKGKNQDRYGELKKELDQLEELKPKEIARAMVMRDIGPVAPPTHVLGIGLYTSPKEEVQPGFLSILDERDAYILREPHVSSTGRRSALARWLVDPSNPLVARVMVNRIWHYHFGQGIVATPSDFGVMGTPPTHLELLDWLASQFISEGWSIKALHRQILTSASFGQSSLRRPEIDEERADRLLARFPPQRLDAESIRDAALLASGHLNRQVGGPSVFPPLPEGRTTPIGGWKVSDRAADQLRRSVYVFVRRNDRYPLFEAFDFPDPHESCACRNETTSPQQALTLLNGQLFSQWSAAMASQIESETDSLVSQRIHHAWIRTFSRPPSAWDQKTALEFVEQQANLVFTEMLSREPDHSAEPTEAAVAETRRRAEHQALADLCLMLLNSNEFVFRF